MTMCRCGHYYDDHYITFGGASGCSVIECADDPCPCSGYRLDSTPATPAREDPIAAATMHIWMPEIEKSMRSSSILSRLTRR